MNHKHHVGVIVLLSVSGLAVSIGLTGCAVDQAAVDNETVGGLDIAALPFERRVCRLYFHCLNPFVYDGKERVPRKPCYGLSPEELTDVVADMGTEAWSGPASWTDHGAFWPSDMIKRCTGVPQEYMPRMVKRAHERGMMYLALEQLVELENRPLEFDSPKYIETTAKMGTWVVKAVEGNAWGQMNALCPPYRDWMGRFMAEYVTVGDVDGFWFDGTPGAGDAGPYGQAAYKRDTGKDVPKKIDWDSQEFKEWFVWRYDKSVEFFNEVTAAAAKEKPYVAAVMNYYARPMDRRWDAAHPMRRLDNINWYPGIESGESSFNAKVGRALTPRAEMWMWAQWRAKEVVHGVAPYPDPDRYIAKGVRVIAHGLAPCFGGFGCDIHLWKDGIKKAFDEFKIRRPYMDGETVKYAAILVSQRMRDFHDSKLMWSTAGRMEDIHRTEHLLTDVIFDDSLTPERLAAYPVVVLSNATCLSDAQCAALQTYVEGGGTLLATFETSMRDEWGNQRDNFGLADLFGVDYVETGEEVAQILVPQTEALKNQFGRFVNFVAPAVSMKLREGSDAELLLTHSSRSLHGLSVTVDEYDSDVPAVVRRRVGKGIVYYIGPDIASGYTRNRLPQAAELVSYLERAAATPPVEFDAPKLLEVTALDPGDKRLTVHLVNMSAWASNDGRMAPLANIGVKVNHGTVKRATLALSGTKLTVQNNSVTVPAVGYGEVVVLEIE